MKDYEFNTIEPKWQKYWEEHETYKVEADASRPKFYVLDMFPYPSGAGLHVGHPLGYIASDIYSRYKRQKGFNVLHPMGYDAFGLPAEQYAIQTGQHPAVTTENNISRYRSQLDKLGFSFDWSREVRTCSPDYYKWTQWAFEKMFQSYYDTELGKARPISELISKFEKENTFSWNTLSAKEKEDILEKDYRLAYQAVTMVNWCEGLGTVLANDEVKDGLSVRGGFPVQQKPMKQWLLRVSAYAERLEEGLSRVDWSESLKEIQRNWIGKSVGATIFFDIDGQDRKLEIFTTRADTIFGVTFMVLAPEHPMVAGLTTPENRDAVDEYLQRTSHRSERERMAETKIVSGCFTGSYAVNPFNGTRIPIYISDYVLIGYGTGAIMAVPAHDSRDWAFARHFNLPVVPIIECDVTESSYDAKEGKLINSDFLTGLDVKDAIPVMFERLEKMGIGHRKINYRLRDATFSRQRYWGEPFPVYFDDEGIPHLVPESQLPVQLPEMKSFQPSSDGRPPLANVAGWKYETSTMPGFAGSSAYYLRYMDPHNDKELVSKEANSYWRNVDLYVGGIEHATGHLIYSRFWNKFLYDLGYVTEDEPFMKLINQGMIQGQSKFVYRVKGTDKYVSLNLKDGYDTQEIHVDVNIVDGDVLDLDAFKKWRPDFENAEFILEDGKYICGSAVEKMSKSMYNVVNPDLIVEKYGADTLRLYEMFLGPLQMSKPWDTKGIEGVNRFLRKFWKMAVSSTSTPATEENMKSLHKCIKKVNEDILAFSFNTSVSAFMICINELSDQKATSRDVFLQLVSLIQPFAPYFAAELWQLLGGEGLSVDAAYPVADESFLVESSFEYPVSVNGKLRFKRRFPLDMSREEIEKAIASDQDTLKFTDGAPIKKIIIVPGKIINIVK